MVFNRSIWWNLRHMVIHFTILINQSIWSITSLLSIHYVNQSKTKSILSWSINSHLINPFTRLINPSINLTEPIPTCQSSFTISINQSIRAIQFLPNQSSDQSHQSINLSTTSLYSSIIHSINLINHFTISINQSRHNTNQSFNQSIWPNQSSHDQSPRHPWW